MVSGQECFWTVFLWQLPCQRSLLGWFVARCAFGPFSFHSFFPNSCFPNGLLACLLARLLARLQSCIRTACVHFELQLIFVHVFSVLFFKSIGPSARLAVCQQLSNYWRFPSHPLGTGLTRQWAAGPANLFHCICF